MTKKDLDVWKIASFDLIDVPMMVKVSKCQVKSETCENTFNRQYAVQNVETSGNDSPRTARRVLDKNPNMGERAAKAASAQPENKGYCATHI